jgi:hypothetical protein
MLPKTCWWNHYKHISGKTDKLSLFKYEFLDYITNFETTCPGNRH